MLRTIRLAALTLFAATLASAADIPVLKNLAAMAGDVETPTPAASGVPLKPLINGTDVSAALGTYRMDAPQFGCPMTVYGRFEDGSLDIWTDAQDSRPRKHTIVHGETHLKPPFHFMSTGQSYDFFKYADGGYASYIRTVDTRVTSSGASLNLYQESATGLSRRGVPVAGRKEYSSLKIALSLDASGSMTLTYAPDAAGGPVICTLRKISTEPGPLAPRIIPYAFETEIQVGAEAGILHATFDMEEFSDFRREADLRNFKWTITLANGQTLAPELPLPEGDWRKLRAGFISPGMVQPNRASPFFVELESGASTRLGAVDHVLRFYMECEETLTSCILSPSAVTESDPGFFALPFSNFAKQADLPVRLNGHTQIQLKRR